MENDVFVNKCVFDSLLLEISNLEDLVVDLDLTKSDNIQYITMAIGRILSIKDLMRILEDLK